MPESLGVGESAPTLHVVLVEPEIAANTGAVGRTCMAAGARLWLVRPLGFHIDDRHLRRAGMDYWRHLDYRVVDSLDEAAQAIGRGCLWPFTTKARKSLFQAMFNPGDALVLGPESRGLSDAWLATQPEERRLRIPMRPEARSLNLSVAAAVGIYEATRQINGFGETPHRGS